MEMKIVKYYYQLHELQFCEKHWNTASKMILIYFGFLMNCCVSNKKLTLRSHRENGLFRMLWTES